MLSATVAARSMRAKARARVGRLPLSPACRSVYAAVATLRAARAASHGQRGLPARRPGTSARSRAPTARVPAGLDRPTSAEAFGCDEQRSSDEEGGGADGGRDSLGGLGRHGLGHADSWIGGGRRAFVAVPAVECAEGSGALRLLRRVRAPSMSDSGSVGALFAQNSQVDGCPGAERSPRLRHLGQVERGTVEPIDLVLEPPLVLR